MSFNKNGLFYGDNRETGIGENLRWNQFKMAHLRPLKRHGAVSTGRRVMATPPTMTVSGSSTISGADWYRSIEDNQTLRRDNFSLPMGNFEQRADTPVRRRLPMTSSVRYNVTTPTAGLPYRNEYGCGAEFTFYGDEFEIYEEDNLYNFDIIVDEGNGFEFISSSTLENATSTKGGLYRKIAFTSVALRTVRIIAGIDYLFGGILCDPAFSVNRSSRHDQAPKCVIMGDSWGKGTSNDKFGYTFVNYLERSTLWNILPDVIGSTGYVDVSGTIGQEGYSENYKDRWDLTGKVLDPDIVLMTGSVNDYPLLDQDIEDNARHIYSSIIADTNAFGIVVLPFTTPSQSDTRCAEVSTILKSLCFEYGLPCIEPLTGNVYSETGVQIITGKGKWITGTGSTAIPAGDGNADYLIGADSSHPSDDGGSYVAQMILDGLIAIGG